MSVDYLEKQLGDNERILYTERHHWMFPVTQTIKWILAAGVWLVIVLVFDIWLLPDAGWVAWGYLLLIIPLIRIAWGFLAWLNNVYVVTNRRVVEATGTINKAVMDSSLEKLTDVALRQGFLGRILGYGDIEILTAASTAGITNLKQIKGPLQFKTAMVNAKEALEQEFGGSD